MPTVGPRKTRRTNERLARIRLNNPNALSGIKADSQYTPREVRRVRRVDARQRANQAAKKAARTYNPLAPLTGQREKAEMQAAERLEFGDQSAELRRAIGAQAQTQANRAQYYDDYRQALRESTARINEANRLNVEAAEKRVDTSYEQDKAGVAARDAQASETAAKLGRGPVQSIEGAQAVEAQRSQGNQAAANLRGQAAADTKYLDLREATSVLAKTEDQRRQDAKREQLRGEEKKLAKDRGAFRTDFRRQSRESERTYALARKEFGLKEKDLRLEHKDSAADRALEKQKLATQKIVANIYASADKAGARSQVRVAKLQLEKGKITKDQYKKVVIEYQGLYGGGGKDGGGKDGADKPKLQTWERDKVETAVTTLRNTGAKPNERQRAIDALVKRGLPPRLARIAWKRYVTNKNKAVNRSPGGDAAQ